MSMHTFINTLCGVLIGVCLVVLVTSCSRPQTSIGVGPNPVVDATESGIRIAPDDVVTQRQQIVEAQCPVIVDGEIICSCDSLLAGEC